MIPGAHDEGAEDLNRQTYAQVADALEPLAEDRDRLIAALSSIVITDQFGVDAANRHIVEISELLKIVDFKRGQIVEPLETAIRHGVAASSAFMADLFVARARAMDLITAFKLERQERAQKLADEQKQEENRRRALAAKPKESTMDNEPGTDIAVYEKPRLEMPALVAEQYGLDPEGWRVLVDAVFPLARTAAGVAMALAYCKKRNLDPFRKSIHLVPMKVKDSRGQEKEIETVWPGIGELRITAQRQSDFFGYDECEFGPDKPFQGLAKVQKWEGGRKSGWEEVKWDGMVPEWAQFTVYKMIHGARVALKGPKVFFIETYSPVSRWNPAPNERWTRAPRQMLEKNAEAAALRRAWPDVFGDEATFEEMEGKTLFTGQTIGPDGEVHNEHKPEEAAEVEATEPETEGDAENIVDAEIEEVSEEAAAGEGLGEERNAPTAAKEDPQPDAAADVNKQSIPETRAQWEVFQDNILDKLEDRKTAETLSALRANNAARISAAPDDIRETIETAFAARLAKLSGGSNAATGSGAGEANLSPEE